MVMTFLSYVYRIDVDTDIKLSASLNRAVRENSEWKYYFNITVSVRT